MTEGTAYRIGYENGPLDIPLMGFQQRSMFLFHLFGYYDPVLPAFDLVVPIDRNGVTRAALLTFPAFTRGIKQAIGIRIVTPSGSDRKRGIGNHRGDPDITTGFGDQALVKTESAQTGGKGHVTLGP